MLKKILVSLLVVAMVVTSFSACGGSTPPPAQGSAAGNEPAQGSQATSAGEKLTVKVAYPTWTKLWLQPVMDEYNASQDKYIIEGVEVASGSDLYTKMTMMLQSPKTCPDVMMEDGFMINADVAAGRLLQLDDLLADWADLKNFSPAVLEGSKAEDGKLYGIPISTDTQGIYYNKKLLEKIGIASPWQPKDWEEVLSVAKKLKDDNAATEDFIPAFIYATKSAPEETSMRTFQVLLSGTEGMYPEQIYNKAEKKWVVDSAKLTQVFEFVNRAFNVEKIGPNPSFASQQNVGDIIISDHMKNGKIGMYFTGSWTMNSFSDEGRFAWPEAADHWGFANIPTATGAEPKFTTMSGGWTWAIPQNANNKEGAAEFLKVLGSKKVQLKQLAATGDITVRDDIAKDEAYLSRKLSSVREATEQLSFTHFRPSVDGYASLTLLFTEAVESVAIGAATPAQAVENLKSEMIRTVGADRVIVK